MARKKISEKEGVRTSVAIREKPSELPSIAPVSAKATLEALCPVCGRAIPERRATVRSKLGNLETQPYFESIEWDKNKPFGIRLPTNGKASFKNWDYIDRDEAPEFFEALKNRFLQALREWLDKGWITREEITAVQS